MRNRILILLLFLGMYLCAVAQEEKPAEKPKPTKWEGPQKEKIPVLSGIAVWADLCGPIMKIAGASFDQIEIGARLGLKERFYPVFEFGIGESTREGAEITNKFKTRAPYFRAGIDINFNKKMSGNRFFLGGRYGFSSFDYDYIIQDQLDPVWGTVQNVELNDLNAKIMWIEAVLGFETKLWSFIRMGWTMRYKYRVSNNHDVQGEPWYVPGYGRNDTSTFGGSVNMVFDLGKSMRNQKKK